MLYLLHPCRATTVVLDLMGLQLNQVPGMIAVIVLFAVTLDQPVARILRKCSMRHGNLFGFRDFVLAGAFVLSHKVHFS